MSGFGPQTVTVIARVPIGHGDYDDGERTEHPGCLVQPMSAEEQARHGLSVTRRWRLVAPAGLTARAQDEAEVDDVLGDDGQPLRLGWHGPSQPLPDRIRGGVHHVEGLLHLSEGA